MERFATDAKLLGADGIAFAANGDLYVAANERNAIVRVKPDGTVEDAAANTNAGPIEFPASLAFAGNALYASNFDIERGANAPNAPGVGASIARLDVGVGGLPLPFTGPSQQPATPGATSIPASTSTPAPSQPTAVPPTATAVVPTPVGPTIAPISTPGPIIENPPGMPTTGGGEPTMLLAVLVGILALLSGLGLRYARHPSRQR